MNGFLLDTNVVSEPFKRNPSRRVFEWLQSADEDRLFVSVLTLGELRKGIQLADGRRKSTLERWLERDLEPRFAGRILAINSGIADTWGRLTAQSRRSGTVLPAVDGLLTATAIRHDLTLVTRNLRHVPNAAVQVMNPWTD